MAEFTPKAPSAKPRDSTRVNVRLGHERKEKFTVFCRKHGMSLTEMITQMIDHCMKEKTK